MFRVWKKLGTIFIRHLKNILTYLNLVRFSMCTGKWTFQRLIIQMLSDILRSLTKIDALHLLYSFPIAAFTNYHTFSSLNNTHLFRCYAGQKSEWDQLVPLLGVSSHELEWGCCLGPCSWLKVLEKNSLPVSFRSWPSSVPCGCGIGVKCLLFRCLSIRA